jgi:hypothetical protein
LTLLDHEPPVEHDDTQPRPLVFTEFTRIGDEEPEEEQPERTGCRNPLLIGTVLIAFVCLFLTAVGAAGLAGYRDGVNIKGTSHAVAIVGTIGAQATLARSDCSTGHYELCFERCKFIATQQPSYPGMGACMSTAQVALKTTPTLTPTVTPLPPTSAPSVAATQPGGGSGFTREDLFVRGQEAYRTNSYAETQKWLEALRGLDADYQRKDVEDMLFNTYLALAGQNQNDGKLSEMVIVIEKARAIRPLPPESGWDFTVNVAQLYLDGRAYLSADNFAQADRVFKLLMEQSPDYQRDSRKLACQAFAQAGDTAASAKYNCQ